ncbi:MAG: Trk system potassium transporter TrkA [Christensenellaceae bacterium]|nr:Trk system potassium transporter TrkA [Christensenellaceae bacterium]
MNIVIVGDGKVGNALCERLAEEQHDVVVIDTNPAVLAGTTDRLDVLGVVGNGATYSVQKEAGVDKADLLVAATASDERNLLCCLVAKKLGAKQTIARVRNPEYSQQMQHIKEELRLSMAINPELATAEEISRILRCPEASRLSPFAGGKAEVVNFTLKEGDLAAGMSLAALRSQVAKDILVCGVQRGEDVIIPGGDFVLQIGDKLLVVASPRAIDAFFKKIRRGRSGVRSVMIAGGSRIAYYLARMLERVNIKTLIIDPDEGRCRELTQLLPGARIVLGDASDQELLHEEGLEAMDAFVSLTGLDEQNIVISMYASACKVGKVITKVNSISFPAMMEKIGLDTVVSPKAATADRIAAYVRAMQDSQGAAMETMYKLMGGRIEALDFLVKGKAPFLGIPLKDLKRKPQTIIACIVRGGKAIIPDGNTDIRENDNVIVVTANDNINSLGDILK